MRSLSDSLTIGDVQRRMPACLLEAPNFDVELCIIQLVFGHIRKLRTDAA